jgi:hypothetical protein
MDGCIEGCIEGCDDGCLVGCPVGSAAFTSWCFTNKTITIIRNGSKYILNIFSWFTYCYLSISVTNSDISWLSVLWLPMPADFLQ